MSKVSLFPGDNRETLRRLIDDGVRVHSVVTDPPYGLVSIQKRFGKEGAAPARTEKNDGSFSRLSGGFMGKCYHPATEILTFGGWRPVGEVELGETVATLDPSTREMVWQPVVQRHVYDFAGDLVHVAHRSAEQLVTPNHKVVLSRDGNRSLTFCDAESVPRKFHLTAQAAPQRGRKDRVKVIAEREYGKDRERRLECAEFDPNPFFRFFGLWLGDGFTVTRSDDHPANDFFGFSVTKDRKVVAIREVLSALNIRFTETKMPDGGTVFYCYHFALLWWLKDLGGSREKFIPGRFFEWDAAHLEQLYRGLIETDGCVQGAGDQEVFYTSSRRLADDFQRLCLHTGRSAAVCFKPGGKRVVIAGHECVSNDAWVACVLKPGKRMYAEAGTGRGSDVMSFVEYIGKVHCIGVEKHHIVYTRFNGKPVWSGNSWDATGIERDPEFWRLIWEILLPGGYVFAFSGSRTGHWQACAMEQAGFIMHPMHGWCFGSGFPKAHNASKAIDKMLGAERPVVGHFDNTYGINKSRVEQGYRPGDVTPGTLTTAGSDEAAQWEGWAYGTQTQKPALEPIYLGQKPFSEKTGAANLLKHGVGAVNIDGCRVPHLSEDDGRWGNGTRPGGFGNVGADRGSSEPNGRRNEAGRHPANLIHDGSPEVVALFPHGKSGAMKRLVGAYEGESNTGFLRGDSGPHNQYGDSGSASRFFHAFPPDTDPIVYQAKAGKADRAGSKHPTVKPVALMQYLIRHITPPGGVVLDPFAGSGTTAEAAKREGFDCILMEAEPEYVEFLRKRFVDELEHNECGSRVEREIEIQLKRAADWVDTDLAELLG
jgi:site-specific DNA-methyltransferase (adenine-specific)